MSDNPQPQTVILGAGIVGVCCARYLQLRGESVTLVDRDAIGDGCSFGNAGVLGAWSCEGAAKPGLWKDLPGWLLDPLGPVSLKLPYLPRLAPWLVRFFRAAEPSRRAAIADAMFTINHPTVEMFNQLLAGSGHEGLVVDSSYIFATRNAAKLSISTEGYRNRIERGADVRQIGAGELRELEPDLAPDYIGAVVVGGQARVTNPGRLVKVIGDMVLADGGEFLQATVHAARPQPGGGAVLETSRGTLRPQRLVIAAGAWSHQLARNFGLEIPLEGERGYHMEFRDPGVSLRNSVHDSDRVFVASSMEGGLRCAGTSEFNALDAAPDWRRARIFRGLGKAMLPGLNVESAFEWMGRRPALPDTIPVVGQAPGHRGVFLAFGHGHLGLTGAPMTGRIIAGLATGERMNVDPTPYRADRF